MKTTRHLLLGTLLCISALVSCQRDYNELATTEISSDQQVAENSTQDPPNNYTDQYMAWYPNPYLITLLGPTQVGTNWEWIWSIQNVNPGNGSNGSVQDLSHWGMTLGSCFDMNSVISAAHSTDGVNWKTFTPTLQVDNSSCVSTPVLKFDFGTQGSRTSYYRLVVNQYYTWGISEGYYKSGKKTGCIPFNFFGIACSTWSE
ncbi:MAG: hypothetical protein H7Y42_13845 [Chitinophagaceae bacterium]|nr:hypothetical protein [Chitinophagaceae bacterium]